MLGTGEVLYHLYSVYCVVGNSEVEVDESMNECFTGILNKIVQRWAIGNGGGCQDVG